MLFSVFAYANDEFIAEQFKTCDQIIDNPVFKSCYNYKLKSTTASLITLKAENITLPSIVKRPSFYEDKNIPEQYRTKSSDYTNSGFDRGHIQSDSSNDYSAESLKLTYAMSNITFQYPITNRQSYYEVEKQERKLTTLYELIHVLTIIHYTEKQVNGISVPSEYIKVFFNSKYEPVQCYVVPNDNKKYSLDETEKSCSLILKEYK